MKNITEKASDDGCIDEMTWAFFGYGGPCCNQIMGNPGVNKGGQTVMLYDVSHYPQAYCHQHLQVKKDPCFTTQGANEVYKLIQRIGLLVKPSLLSTSEVVESENVVVMLPREIYNKKPYITADNHFSSVTITNYHGKNGFGYTCTTWQDQLPTDINKQYHNHI